MNKQERIEELNEIIREMTHRARFCNEEMAKRYYKIADKAIMELVELEHE